MEGIEITVMGRGYGREQWMVSLSNICCKLKSGLMACWREIVQDF